MTDPAVLGDDLILGGLDTLQFEGFGDMSFADLGQMRTLAQSC